MTPAEIHRYASRADVDQQIEAMRERIIAERRPEIGRQAAWQEARDVTTDFYRAEYHRSENEVTARGGWDA